LSSNAFRQSVSPKAAAGGLASDPVWKEENLSKKRLKRRYEIME
jgi:hypothetical protein